MNNIENLKNFPSKPETNITGKERILFVNPKSNKKGTIPPVNYIEVQSLSQLVPSIPGPQGVQGPIGPQGVPGPVGPAGLNWQGAWSATGTYVVDDAVGYNGASWFCIANVGPSAVPPDIDTTNWALLAAQGATGPQGPQGIAGTGPVLTSGGVPATASTTDPSNVLIYDRNVVFGSNTNSVRLPDNAPIGKEVIVQYNGVNPAHSINIFSFDLSTSISVNNASSNTSFYTLKSSETIRFISRGTNSWIAEYIAGTPISFNNTPISSVFTNITETVINNTVAPLTAAQLNAAYPAVSFGIPSPVGLKVYCRNIVGGGLVYIRVATNTWVSAPITAVV
jgi:hypothetical protein